MLLHVVLVWTHRPKKPACTTFHSRYSEVINLSNGNDLEVYTGCWKKTPVLFNRYENMIILYKRLYLGFQGSSQQPEVQHQEQQELHDFRITSCLSSTCFTLPRLYIRMYWKWWTPKLKGDSSSEKWKEEGYGRCIKLPLWRYQNSSNLHSPTHRRG